MAIEFVPWGGLTSLACRRALLIGTEKMRSKLVPVGAIHLPDWFWETLHLLPVLKFKWWDSSLKRQYKNLSRNFLDTSPTKDGSRKAFSGGRVRQRWKVWCLRTEIVPHPGGQYTESQPWTEAKAMGIILASLLSMCLSFSNKKTSWLKLQQPTIICR